MGTSQSHTRRGEICHRCWERPFEWKRRLIERWRRAGSSSRIYTPPSAVLSPVALEPCHSSSSRPCFDSTSFRRDCSLSWITFTSWDGSWFYDGARQKAGIEHCKIWSRDLQVFISKQMRLFALYLIGNNIKSKWFFVFIFLFSR